MADDRYRQDRPQKNHPEDLSSRAPSHHHHHRPLSSADEPRRSSDSSRASMAASVNLPSIHDRRPSGYAPGPPPPSGGRGYPHDPRYASPNAVNGYPPPPGSQPGAGSYLPPMQAQQDPRAQGYPQPDPRGPYYDDRRAPHPDAGYGPDAYYYRGPPGAPPNGYPRAHPGAYGPEYAQAGGGPPMAQAAPRQRTSIACRYCRKRKIRCSGYQSAPGGKCQNCARMNQECIFQPVSSSSSTAFIPVSAVPGGVPPGTQLFGAYGQPLAPSSVPGPPHYPPHSGPPHQHGPPPAGAGYYQSMQSPTESFSSYGDPRGEDPQMAGRRRRRTPEEQDEGYRLPPPRTNVSEDDIRRRSPAEASNDSSPGGLGHLPYHGAGARQAHPVQSSGSHATTGAGGRSPGGQNGSSGSSTPARSAGQGQRASQQPTSSVMSLSNLVDKSDIDKGMISRLNRPRDS